MEELNEQYEGHGHEDFDWGDLERRLGEATTDESGELVELTAEDFRRICKSLLALLGWAVAPTLRKRKTAKPSAIIARRVVAMAWVMCPELFSADGKQKRSLKEVADSLKLHKAVLSEETSEFSKQFKFRNQFQIGHG